MLSNNKKILVSEKYQLKFNNGPTRIVIGMLIQEKYNVSFINKTINCRIDNEIVGPDSSILYSPLSYYVYLAGHYKAIDEIIIEIDQALTGNSFEGIEVGTEEIILTSEFVTIISSDGENQCLPTSDLKVLLQQYKTFLNTKPLNGRLDYSCVFERVKKNILRL